MEPKLKVKLLSDRARAPERIDPGAAGYDLFILESGLISASWVTAVPTGIAVEIPEGYYGRIAPRSGLALEGLHVMGGVIDSSYRGEIKVLLLGLMGPVYLMTGDRIAQLIIEKIITPEIEIVETLSETERGSNGFGSSGR